MADSPVPLPLRSLSASQLLGDLLAVSMTGVIYYTPIYDPAGSGEIIDFNFEYLNPTAQRMMSMPEVPTLTHNEQWPHSREHGTFDFHVDAYVSGEPRELNINYQADGYDNYYRLAARRSGEGLLVSFTDTADQPRSPVEVALRESQARERQARAEAEVQRQRFYNMLMQLPAHVAVHEGPNHRFTLVNPHYQRIANGRDLLGQPIRDAWPELVSHGILDALDQVYQTGEPFMANELPVQVDFTRTGRLEQVYYNFFFLALRDTDGQINGVLNFSYDVTDLVRARQQVEQLNQQLEARVQEHTRAALAAQQAALTTAQRLAHERESFYQVFEQTPALIALLRAPKHRFEYVNPAYQQLFPGRQLVGLPIAEAVPEAQEQGFVAVLDRVYQTGESYFGAEVPFAVELPDGQPPHTVYFNFTYQAYRENGLIAGVTIFAFDATLQVLARVQREAEREQLRTLFMEAPAPIAILDGPDLVYQLVNPAYQRIFPGRTLLGKPLLEALPDMADIPVLHNLRRVYQTGESFVAQEMHMHLARHENGPLEDIYCTFTYQARRNSQGVVDGVLVFAHEVTDQVLARRVVEEGGQQARSLAKELADSNTQLLRTNMDLDNFIYTASHDLKAPISNIEGLLYILQDELPPAVKQEEFVGPTLTRMLDSVERFKRTIDQLTEVSKLQKAHSPDIKSVSLAAVVEDVRQDILPLVQQTGAKLVIDVAALPPIHFSEKNLRSVVYNLLSNALKYHSPDRTPHVDVRAHVHAGYTVLEVHDNGLGIDPAHQPRLFTMFQRFHDHVEGSGIGLYMVKRMVENGGGHIRIHSQLGAGTTVFVHLPHTLPA